MRDAVRFPLVLSAISLCSAAGLALSYTLTRDEIIRQEQLRKARGLAAVLGVELPTGRDEMPWQEFPYLGRSGDPDPSFTVCELADAERGTLYAAFGKAQGYSSKINVVVAVDQGIERGLAETTILGVTVISQLETPGLGSHCQDREFEAQFRNLPYPQLDLIKGVPYRDPDDAKDKDRKVAAITGATVTSKAVVEAIRLACGRIRYHVEHTERGKPAEAGGAPGG